MTIVPHLMKTKTGCLSDITDTWMEWIVQGKSIFVGIPFHCLTLSREVLDQVFLLKGEVQGKGMECMCISSGVERSK